MSIMAYVFHTVQWKYLQIAVALCHNFENVLLFFPKTEREIPLWIKIMPSYQKKLSFSEKKTAEAVQHFYLKPLEAFLMSCRKTIGHIFGRTSLA